jgi:pimeloyl-ACP methyl ester carboxylesterase
VTVVGHSLGGLLARGLAVRRPDLVAGIVTLGSPVLALGAHHAALTRSLDALGR